jgi:hypothetical protein
VTGVFLQQRALAHRACRCSTFRHCAAVGMQQHLGLGFCAVSPQAMKRFCALPRSIMQLANLLDPARAGRADKLSTLADAVKEITRLRTDTAALQRLNKVLEVWCWKIVHVHDLLDAAAVVNELPRPFRGRCGQLPLWPVQLKSRLTLTPLSWVGQRAPWTPQHGRSGLLLT